ncbi:MAG: hypothetical protein OEY36_13725 [Gammaproteobacteria bacterium]|nr:hypothetical protein [Gammaproteobacteria bacterium]
MMNESVQLKKAKRTTELYLRALWGKGFALYQAESVDQSVKAISYIVNDHIYLSQQVSSGHYAQYYFRAAAVHAALHLLHRDVTLEFSSFNLMQRSMIGLVEDLRIELKAIRRFPGLRKLWLNFHQDSRLLTAENAESLMLRLSRSVLDPSYRDSH